jgi:hypothetical protein
MSYFTDEPLEEGLVVIEIDIVGGAVRLRSAPDDVVILIRDYDCPDDWEGRKIDADGNGYQPIHLYGDGTVATPTTLS